MPSINKQSLREEFDSIKSEFQSLSERQKVSPEVATLFRAMMGLFDILIAVFLEKSTRKNSKNSSLPPSQTQKDESFLASRGSSGKGSQQNDDRFANFRTCESVDTVEVNHCDHCGEDLSGVAAVDSERRTQIDIVFEKVVTHIDAQIKECPNCDGRVKGAFSSDMPGPLQYGLGIKAYLLNLLVAQMVSLNRVQKAVRALIGSAISEATMLKYILQLHQSLQQWEQSAVEYLLNQPIIHVDETSMRVDGKNQWVHVYSSGEVTLKVVHPSRGKEAMEAIGIIPRYDGYIIHDCWSSYLSYDHCGHGLCGSHLLRELVFVIDSNGYAWARHMKRLLQKTCAKVSKRKNKKLTKKEYAGVQKVYRSILTRGEKEMPVVPERVSGKRGRVAKSDAHNLWERLKTYEAAVLLFAREASVSFTNNRAERDLRMGKVKQKVSGCFRKASYAQAYCRITSYLQTMARKGFNPLIAIQTALAGGGLD